MVVIFALKIQIKNEPLCGFVFKCYAKASWTWQKTHVFVYICTCTCNLTRIILSLYVQIVLIKSKKFFLCNKLSTEKSFKINLY